MTIEPNSEIDWFRPVLREDSLVELGLSLLEINKIQNHESLYSINELICWKFYSFIIFYFDEINECLPESWQVFHIWSWLCKLQPVLHRTAIHTPMTAMKQRNTVVEIRILVQSSLAIGLYTWKNKFEIEFNAITMQAESARPMHEIWSALHRSWDVLKICHRRQHLVNSD